MREPAAASVGAVRSRPDSDAGQRLLTGWGRTTPTTAAVVAPREEEQVLSALAALGADGGAPRTRGFIPRGLGRSYGDAAQCAGGVVIEMTGLDRIGPIDPDTGTVEVGGGVSLDALLRAGLDSGWFVPVSPGTRQVTIGGAIAADVHGKNHHKDGSFCGHVSSLTLVTPGLVQEVGPDTDPDLFWATAGGMGLTGVVTRARVAMRRVETSWMTVATERHRDIDSLMEGLERVDRVHRYSVAWVDCAARGRSLGRGVLDAGEHAALADLPERRRRHPLAPPRRAGLKVPSVLPSGLVNPLTVAAFNEAWFYKSPSRPRRVVPVGSFFHPLDAVTNWNVLYGPRGFVQYQFVVGDEHRDLVPHAIELLQGASAPCSLAVLKRFGPSDPGPLSFPMPGWTLALDLAIGPPGLPGALRGLDEMVAGAGGRVYLAKDARLDPETFRVMYPRLAEFEMVRKRVDPDGLLQSDLARRLGICEDAPS